ncbi:MAG: ATP-dependent zinc metalloprotease FtsH [Candidatus Omnitrophota bacterium]|nr:ATP-dependent zinc metalloprotease FtsH [Candidatus Omnitrophota bacterium]
MANHGINSKNNKNKKKKPLKPNRVLIIWIIIGLSLLYLYSFQVTSLEGMPKKLSYSRFYQLVKDGMVKSCEKRENFLRGTLTDESTYTVNIPSEDKDLIKILRENVEDFTIEPPKTMLVSLFYSLGPVILFITFLWFFLYRGAQQGGGRLLSFGKSRARQIIRGKEKTTFKDVAGVDEAKDELREIIEFLKDPKRFQRLGGKIPKGVLLMGYPGTGKTLLAKAVSGEANVPFFSISGSDFVEMFVGIGAARVRDLFEQAKKATKGTGHGAIIFIDEIDAVGRQRFAGIGGGHDEREQTLNALLSEMDGFDTQKGVILIAATNRPDVLDSALLRPGRFDRRIVVDRPDIRGREEILKVHTRDIKIDKSVDLKAVARQTPGFSGADIANLTNEAAILAAREGKEAVNKEDMESAIERVIAGPEKKSRVISKKEKILTAYHESGHALLALIIPEADPLHKVSILPRGMALGYTMTPPLEDKHIYTKGKLMVEITVALGGRVSEEIIFGELSTGAESDLKVVTEKARMMVTRFGMSEKLGHLRFGKSHQEIFLGRDIGEERDYSEATALIIDQEIRKIVDSCYKQAKEILLKYKAELKLLADVLLVKEVLDGPEVARIVKIKRDMQNNTVTG